MDKEYEAIRTAVRVLEQSGQAVANSERGDAVFVMTRGGWVQVVLTV